MCEVSGTDGFGKCLMYAVAGWSLLHERGFIVQGGSLMLVSDPANDAGIKLDAGDGGFERGEYHCWVSRQVGDRVEVVDLASRHYRRYVEQCQVESAQTLAGGAAYIFTPAAEQIPWTRDDPPTSVWTTNGHADNLAYFYGDVPTSYGVWRAIADMPEETARIRDAARLVSLKKRARH